MSYVVLANSESMRAMGFYIHLKNPYTKQQQASPLRASCTTGIRFQLSRRSGFPFYLQLSDPSGIDPQKLLAMLRFLTHTKQA